MSRLDEIKARYGWCERCANHDPRDRRDHRHLRSQTEIDALWLVKQVESLERWKVEAIEVMSGLRELGRALGLGLGVQITGPAALAEVERLTAEREWFKDRFPCDGMCVDAPEEACSRHGRNPADLWRIIGEVAAERNALAAAHAREIEKVWKVEEVMDDIEGSDPTTWERLRAALTDSEANTNDTQSTDQEA